MAPTSTPKATVNVDEDKDKSTKDGKPTQEGQSDQETPDQEQPVKELSEKEKLEQLQKQNAQRLYNKIKSIKTLTKEAVEAIEEDLKGRKLTQKYRQEVNKWLRDSYAQLEKGSKSRKDGRGKKAKEVTMIEIRRDAKELILKVQKLSAQTYERGKSVRRFKSAEVTLQRLLKYSLTE